MRYSGPLATISLENLTANYRFLRDLAPTTQIGATVKANAYGLGLDHIAPALSQAGCSLFFVALWEEALALRQILPRATIAVLHGLPTEAYAHAAHRRIIPVLNDWRSILTWRAFAQMIDRRLPAFIHMDTGMSRLGLSLVDQQRLCAEPSLLAPFQIAGWISHLARADEPESDMTHQQRRRLLDRLDLLPKAPICLSNSSGLFWGKEFHFDLARPGLALYGGNPTPARPNPMRPVVSVHAPLLQIREIAAGDTVGYGATYTAPSPQRLASIGFGYADGYPRSTRTPAYVAIDAHLAPIVGRVSMDQLMVDVTTIPASALHLGQMATIVGPHRSLDQLALDAGTIPYEILTGLGPRVLRTCA